MSKHDVILQNTWCNFDAIRLLVIFVLLHSWNISKYC